MVSAAACHTGLMENPAKGLNDTYTPFLDRVTVAVPYMWVYDTQDEKIVDITQATLDFLEASGYPDCPRTLSSDIQLEAARAALTSDESITVIEWIKYADNWTKVTRVKTRVDDRRVLEIAHDTTALDPRAEWLARINLEMQRLELESGESISFDEWVVLHMLIKGIKHKTIAETLGISLKTVDYRISRIKIALAVETTEEMMLEVSASDLIHLALVPLDPDNPAMTEVDLYKKVID